MDEVRLPDDDIAKVPGPALVLAGPGTGKTNLLARRTRYLISELGVEPGQVTIITFTRAAAHSMRQRLSNPASKETYVPAESQPELICTMHSLGHRIIREKHDLLGLPKEPGVLDAGSGMREVLLGDAAQILGHAREAGEETESCRTLGRCQKEDTVKCQVCEQYRKILSSCGVVDHDDQILLALQVLREREHGADSWRNRTRHLLVDEYQDINEAQRDFIALLAEGQEEGLFVVGDDDQSIYSWRGGSPEFIRSFSEDFGTEANGHSLSKCWRCPPHIFRGAEAMVAEQNPEREHKLVEEFESSSEQRISIHNVASDAKEARLIARMVAEASDSQCLVIVPTRRFVQDIAQALERQDVPYDAAFGKEPRGLVVFDVVRRWLQDSNDSLCCRELIQSLVDRGALGDIGPRVRKPEKKQEREETLTTISSLWRAVMEGQHSFWSAVQRGASQGDKMLGKVADILGEIQRATEGPSDDVPGFVSLLSDALRPWHSLRQFLAEVAQAAMQWRVPPSHFGAGSVRIVTREAVKGLEADCVFVVGLEEGLWPTSKKGEPRMEEESRLLYVAMTRAQHELHLFHTRKRSAAKSFAQRKPSYQPPTPSSFLASIPEEHRKNVEHW